MQIEQVMTEMRMHKHLIRSRIAQKKCHGKIEVAPMFHVGQKYNRPQYNGTDVPVIQRSQVEARCVGLPPPENCQSPGVKHETQHFTGHLPQFLNHTCRDDLLHDMCGGLGDYYGGIQGY